MSRPRSSPDAPPRDGLVPLEAVLCTEELKGRPTRRPDYETENRALALLIQALADSPRTILQKLADTMLEVFQCDSAGLSLVAKDGKTFYWPAIAGAWKPHAGGGTPRDFGPCGDVLDRDAPLLFKRFERRYPYLQQATPAAEEALLVPFYVEGKAAGTIWAMAHDDRRRFDAEDLRQMESLGRFASAAYQAANAQQLQDARHAALNLMEEAVQSRQSMEMLNRGLRESEERYRTLYTALPVAAFVCDRKAVIQNYNNRAVELWGREPKIGVEQHCGSMKLILPDGTLLPHSQSPIVEVLRTGVPARNVEVFIERPDGTRLFVVVNFVALKDAQGEIVGVVTSFDDITERKRAEDARRESEERYRTLFHACPVAVYSCEVSGVIRDFNPRAVELWGREPKPGDTDERFCGSFKLYRPDGTFMPHDQCPMANVLSGAIPEARDTEVRVERPDGSWVTVVVNIRVLKNERGEIIGAINCFVDVTELKRTHVELQRLNADLKHFSYAASHDLQEPLRMVMSYTQLLAREYKNKLGPEADQYIAHAVDGAQRMQDLLRDLSEYWSVNEQKMENLVPVDCTRVLEKALAYLQMPEQESGAVVTHDSLPTVIAEELPLTLLFQNLIGNAIKYRRPEAPPRIHLSSQGDHAGWRISVTDNGIGIETEHLEKIFAPFKRLHGREVPGTGIGLAICQKIVERYHGRIWVESAYGQGSVFHFTLPEQGGEI